MGAREGPSRNCRKGPALRHSFLGPFPPDSLEGTDSIDRLGSLAGVLIVDYWLVRRKRLELGDLYRKEGVYTYNGGWNWRAVVATLIGCGLSWIGLVVPALSTLYAYAWFVGFGAAAIMYFLFTKLTPPQAFLVLERPTS